MKEAILALLLQLTPYHADVEDAAGRLARLEVISEASSEASEGDVEVAAFLVTTALFETHLAQHVHEGLCREGECDNGRAATLWQLQHGAWLPKERWITFQGSGLLPTTLAAKYAATIYRRGKNMCQSASGAISLYATGRTCGWPGATKRSSFMSKVMAHIHSFVPKED